MCLLNLLIQFLNKIRMNHKMAKMRTAIIALLYGVKEVGNNPGRIKGTAS